MAAPNLEIPPCSDCTKHNAEMTEWSKQMRFIVISLVKLLRQMNPKPVSNGPTPAKKPCLSAELHGTSSNSSPGASSDGFQNSSSSNVPQNADSDQNRQENATRGDKLDETGRASESSPDITVITILDSPEIQNVRKPSDAIDTPVQMQSENTVAHLQSTIASVVSAIQKPPQIKVNSAPKVMNNKPNQKAPSGINNNVQKAPQAVVRIAPNVNSNPTQKSPIKILPNTPHQPRIWIVSPGSANLVQTPAPTVVKSTQNPLNIQVLKRYDGTMNAAQRQPVTTANSSQTSYRVTTSYDPMAPKGIADSCQTPPEIIAIPRQKPIRFKKFGQSAPVAPANSTYASSEVIQQQNPLQAASFADSNITIPDYMQMMGLNGDTTMSPLEIVENMTKAAILMQQHPEAASSSALKQQSPVYSSPTSFASSMPSSSNVFGDASLLFSYPSTEPASNDTTSPDCPNVQRTDSDRTCVNCSTNVTSWWRRNEDRAYICNACYAYQHRNGVKRPAEMHKLPIKKRPRKNRAIMVNSAVHQD
uniref:GATA-type domain-containing protein n=1 Tax=Panagrellus redivivus TaxID=6233 RepID=A0A7E4VGJ9_PANRE